MKNPLSSLLKYIIPLPIHADTQKTDTDSMDIQRLLKKYRKEATLLRPRAVTSPLVSNVSKIGGMPNLTNFQSYPICDLCGLRLNFVIQIFKSDFPDFYFPADKDVFQLFRCPNPNCPGAYSNSADQKVFPFYFKKSDKASVCEKGCIPSSQDIEHGVLECEFRLVNKDDYPMYEDLDEQDLEQMRANLGDEGIDNYTDHYSAKIGTKLNGYPSWTQSPNWPICSCGKKKHFFFQLSSEDPEEGASYPPLADHWSAYGIMIGDCGNIYFFVCQACGEPSIETNWDCY